MKASQETLKKIQTEITALNSSVERLDVKLVSSVVLPKSSSGSQVDELMDLGSVAVTKEDLSEMDERLYKRILLNKKIAEEDNQRCTN